MCVSLFTLREGCCWDEQQNIQRRKTQSGGGNSPPTSQKQWGITTRGLTDEPHSEDEHNEGMCTMRPWGCGRRHCKPRWHSRAKVGICPLASGPTRNWTPQGTGQSQDHGWTVHPIEERGGRGRTLNGWTPTPLPGYGHPVSVPAVTAQS